MILELLISPTFSFLTSIKDMGSKVDDSTYLNTLQNLVNKWIKEIQKVTRMERDPSAGTALQEVSKIKLSVDEPTYQDYEFKDMNMINIICFNESKITH